MSSPIAQPADLPTASVAQARPAGVLFPYAYLMLIFVSALDVIFTYVVLLIGGIEANPIANLVLQSPAEFHGLIVFKFLVVALVMVICEFIGRHAPDTARRLSRWGVLISAFPVLWSSLLLTQHL